MENLRSFCELASYLKNFQQISKLVNKVAIVQMTQKQKFSHKIQQEGATTKVFYEQCALYDTQFSSHWYKNRSKTVW